MRRVLPVVVVGVLGMLSAGARAQPQAAASQQTAPKRPQMPAPPFPYTQRVVSYTNSADGTRLDGTLTVPAGGGRHPAVLLIPGSGPSDRDGTVAGHKPFLVIADHLARHGVAALRVDSRKPQKYYDSTCDDLAADVITGVAFLGKQPEIDARQIGLVAHSLGGLVALTAAARSVDVAHITLLSSFAVPARALEQAQLAQALRAKSMPEEEVRRRVALSLALLDRVSAGEKGEAIDVELRALIKQQLPAGMQPSAKQLEELVTQQRTTVQSPWYRSIRVADPRALLRQVKCPLLAVNGSLDQAVVARDTLSEVEKAARETGNTQVTAIEVYGLNHYLQHAKTGSPLEIAEIEETIAPSALDLIAQWIRSRAGLE